MKGDKMNKTREQRHNEMLDRICTPEIERLGRVEAVSAEILSELRNRVEIDPCGVAECHLIDTVSHVIGAYIK